MLSNDDIKYCLGMYLFTNQFVLSIKTTLINKQVKVNFLYRQIVNFVTTESADRDSNLPLHRSFGSPHLCSSFSATADLFLLKTLETFASNLCPRPTERFRIFHLPHLPPYHLPDTLK